MTLNNRPSSSQTTSTGEQTAPVMRPSTVLHLTSVHRPFDHRIFFKECRSLARAGYDVVLAAPAPFAQEVHDGVRVLGVPKPASRWGRPLIWAHLLRLCLGLRPSLVHLHDPELLFLAPLLRLRLGRSVRLVYDVHEYFVDSIGQKVWVPRPLRRPLAWLAGIGERTLGRAVDGLIFVVEEQAGSYESWRAERAIVHNYPEMAAFVQSRPLPDLPPDRFRLIYAGSLYARRGLLTMLEALPLVVARAPETLLMLGGAFESQEFRAQVEAFVAEHGIGKNVVLLGWIDHARLGDYLGSADVAWLPALVGQQYQKRSISTKQLECMLAGLPLVTGDHPFMRAFTDEARCGLVVPAGEPAAHAQALLWLHEHRKEGREMGARGKALVLARYNWETEAQTLLSFYGRLLTRPPRPAPVPG